MLKFFISASLLVLSTSFVYSASTLEMPLSHQKNNKSLSPQLRKAVEKCKRDISLCIQSMEDGYDYLRERITFFDPKHFRDTEKVAFAVRLVADNSEQACQGYADLANKYENKTLHKPELKMFDFTGKRALKNLSANIQVHLNILTKQIEILQNFYKVFSDLKKISVPYLEDNIFSPLLKKNLSQSIYSINKLNYLNLSDESRKSSDTFLYNMKWVEKTLSTAQHCDGMLDLSGMWRYETLDAICMRRILTFLYPCIQNNLNIQSTLKYTPILKYYLDKGWVPDLNLMIFDGMHRLWITPKDEEKGLDSVVTR